MKKLINLIKKLICAYCGEDMDAKHQDNMSSVIGRPMCEDCYNGGK